MKTTRLSMYNARCIHVRCRAHTSVYMSTTEMMEHAMPCIMLRTRRMHVKRDCMPIRMANASNCYWASSADPKQRASAQQHTDPYTVRDQGWAASHCATHYGLDSVHSKRRAATYLHPKSLSWWQHTKDSPAMKRKGKLNTHTRTCTIIYKNDTV